MAERDMQSNYLWKKVSTTYAALVLSTNAIMIVGKGVTGGNRIALSLIIPKDSLEDEKRYFMVSARYNGGEDRYLQANLSKTLASDVGLFINGNRIESESYEFYIN